MQNQTKILHRISEATDFIFEKIGSDLRLAAPLGLGKPNQLLNDIYDRVVKDRSKKLKIYTALSLTIPQTSEDLGKRFLGPFAKRHWGKDYPILRYFDDAAKNKIPDNIQVHEFYFQAGMAQKSEHLQRNYQSVNYTHVAENVFMSDVNVIVQMIAAKTENGVTRYSFSCNPDITVDVVNFYRQHNKKVLIMGVVHPDLPFLEGDALIAENFFDAVVESPEVTHELFALPRTPIPAEDHFIGFYASLLVRDGGTIQIGIGSLSDTIVSSLNLRQSNHARYVSMAKKLPQALLAHTEQFKHGLYGLTEMLTDGFMHLRKSGILKRYVSEENGSSTYLHGSFILGSKPFYKWLKDLPAKDAQGLRMTAVSKVNDLYDPQEMLLRKQRVHPRFFNTTMQVTPLGEAMSETLPTATVVSGVGGQFNFVSMSRELQDSKSVLMLRSTRLEKNGARVSNIIWNPGHVTIPRHLRDVVITEYGVAELKGKTDENCIKAIIAITDSEFQQKLVDLAKASGKLTKDYVIPKEHTNNTPEMLNQFMLETEFKETFVPYPFGSDFTPEEEKIAIALEALQKDKKISTFKLLKKAFTSSNRASHFTKELERLELLNPKSIKEKLYQKIILAYLN